MERNFAFKILLLLDNVPGHPKLFIGRHPGISVVFIPPNTAVLLSALGQEIIGNVKAAYGRKTFPPRCCHRYAQPAAFEEKSALAP